MRHQQRRSSGIPTVTVLAGPVGLSVCAWKRWAGERHRLAVIVEDYTPVQIVDAWLRIFAEHQEPVVAVAQYLLRRVGRSVQQVLEALSSKTDYELSLMLDVCDLDQNAPADRLCREVIQAHRAGTPLHRWAQRLTMSRMATGETLVACARGLLIVAGPESVPPLLARRPPSAVPGAWIAVIAPLLAEIAIALPQLSLGLAVEVVELNDFFSTPPESRAKAMLREGVVGVQGHDDTAIRQRLESGGGLPSGSTTAAIRRLAADGASDELVDLFAAALRATGGSTNSEVERQRARSAAELFLYERLESHPQTTGAFELNGKLDLSPDFQAQAEIDLLARELKLAIEIDGYFHFQDESAYRRDRRKDLALQKHGYLVLRCLADDIVARFEEILDAILEAVRFLQNRLENLAEKEP